MAGTRLVRSRTGKPPDPTKLVKGRGTTSYTGGGAGGGRVTTPGAPDGQPSPRPPAGPYGRQLIKRSGGTKKDVAAWRSLKPKKRAAMKARVGQTGGSLTKMVRRTTKGR
jgi:hypothetical protein